MAPSKKTPYDEHVAFWKANRKKVIDLDAAPPQEQAFIILKFQAKKYSTTSVISPKNLPSCLSTLPTQNNLVAEVSDYEKTKKDYYLITPKGAIQIVIFPSKKAKGAPKCFEFMSRKRVLSYLPHISRQNWADYSFYINRSLSLRKKSAKNTVEARKTYVERMLSPNSRGVVTDWERRSKNVVSRAEYVATYDPKKGREIVDPAKARALDEVMSGRQTETSCDIEGVDVPMANIRRAKSKSGKIVRYGASSASRLKQFPKSVLTLLNAAFTNEELRKITAYVEYGGGQSRGAAGSARWCKSTDGKKTFSIVSLASDYKDNPEVIVHEFVHVRRHAYGENTRDNDREEAETDLETMGRLTEDEIRKSSCGYYQYLVPGGYSAEKARKLKLEDRRLLTKKPNVRLKGVPLRKRIKEVFPKTHMSLYAKHGKLAKSVLARRDKACPAQAEWIDQYFQVVAPGGRKSELHMHFQKKEDPRRTRSRLIKEQVEKFGPKCKIYEWQDGKKALIYPKEKLMIPTTNRRRVR